MPWPIGVWHRRISRTKSARGFSQRAYELREKVSSCDKLHIEAYHRFLEQQDSQKDKDRRLRYIQDLEQIIYEHPEQLETRAIIGNFFHLHYGRGIRPTSAQAYEDMMQVVLAAKPLHPVHHFRIHLWDDVNKPDRGLDAAAKCGPSAPSVAHMWHMPGHIYSKLHRYNDAAWQQEASARVDHQHMMHDLVLPDQIHNYAHNNEWLCRNLMNVGRVDDAYALAANMVDLPRHPKYNIPAKRNSSSGYGQKRLSEVLTWFEMWDEMVAAYLDGAFERGDTPEQQSEYLYGLGTAQANAGHVAAAAATLAELEELMEKLRTSMTAKPDPEVENGQEIEGKDTKDKQVAEIKATEKEAREAQAKVEKSLATIEQQAAEIRGLLLLAEGDPKAALAELEKAKGMDSFRRAVAYVQAGENEEAIKIAESFVKQQPHQVLPAARAAYLFEACGAHERAEQTFAQLRNLAADADLDAPLLTRLAPLAKRLELPADWRIAHKAADDLGERPELATLGPFRWSPTVAADWVARDHEENAHKLSDFTGRPVVMIFYLGHGCLHCVEQIHAFAKDAERFRCAGIDLIGVSSESPAQLQQAVEAFATGTESIPFPLVCDPDHGIFRTYRCYDDFEELPLHGTFLIDGQGKVRWHDISFEPFTDVDFLLKESQRLLGQ